MEYARNAVRMSALMGLRTTYIYTHDSIGLGEDGPTHQPVEQAAMLRLTPNMESWRPADAVETAVAWKRAILRKEGPVALMLSRQNLTPLERDGEQLANIEKGGYVLYETNANPELIFVATGSEVELALEAAKRLEGESRSVRVVSMPSCELFDRQSDEYREAVLPKAITKRVAVEALGADYWYKYVGLEDESLGCGALETQLLPKSSLNSLVSPVMPFTKQLKRSFKS